MQLPQLAQNCHLGSLTWPTRSGTVGFCAHLCQVAICIFKGVSAVSAEHERLAFCGGAQEREAHDRTGLGWLLSTLYPFSHARGLLLLSSSQKRWILTLGLARYRANLRVSTAQVLYRRTSLTSALEVLGLLLLSSIWDRWKIIVQHMHSE